jgi:hypothetical protein
MNSINVNGTDYIVSSFYAGAVEGKLYKVEARDIGRVQVPVKKNSSEAKRVYAALAARR